MKLLVAGGKEQVLPEFAKNEILQYWEMNSATFFPLNTAMNI